MDAMLNAAGGDWHVSRGARRWKKAGTRLKAMLAFQRAGSSKHKGEDAAQ